MMKKKANAIVIPVYKPDLTENEKRSFLQCLRVFKGREIKLAAPQSLDITAYAVEENKIDVIRFDDSYFENIEGYNRLMLSEKFYLAFSDYRYILIYQTDAYVFRDELDYWCGLGYDYIGAPIVSDHFVIPWLKHLKKRNLLLKLRILKNENVGNGGFSLRKVSSFVFNSRFFRKETDSWSLNEDLFWSFRLPVLNPFFRIPSMKKAVSFSMEEEPAYCFELNGHKLPFGCHGWEKHDPGFWKNHICN